MPRSGRYRLRCCVKGCSKIRTNSAFRFPMNELRSQLWLERCGDESLYKYSTKKLWENKRVCEKHFAPHAFTNSDKHRLNYDAVPSIFPYSNCSSFIAKSKDHVQVTKSNEEIMNKDHSSKVPLSATTDDMQHEYYVIVASPGSTEGIIQEECYVIVPSPEDTEDILEKEYHLPENTKDQTEKESNLSVPYPKNNVNIPKKEYHLPVPLSENTEDISEKEHQFPVLLPELPLPAYQDIKEVNDSSIPLAAGNAIIIQEESYMLVQSPEDIEDTPQETHYSKELSCSSSVPVAIKPLNCPKEFPLLYKYFPDVKNLKETINKNYQNINIPQCKSIDGNNIISPMAVADPCTVSTSFPESCGLKDCTDDLYSDEKNVKKLVKCSFKCGRYFHLTCTGLTKVQYLVMCTSDALRWFCEDCRTGKN